MFTTSKEDNVSRLSGREIDTINESTSKVKDEFNVAANKAGRKVRKLLHTASDEMEHVKDKVKDQIRTNPVQSSLVALGVGVLLGALMRR